MGFWSGVKKGFVGAAKGTWEGVKGATGYAYDFATDGATREQAWNSTVNAANSVADYAVDSYNDPSKPFRDLRDGAASTYNSVDNFVRTADAEQWGELAGGGAFTVATLPVGGLAAKGVARGGAALRAGKAVDAVTDARKAGKLNDGPPCASGSCKLKKKPPKRKPEMREDLDDRFFDEDGNLIWPGQEHPSFPGNGAHKDGFTNGAFTEQELPVGTRLTRYSSRDPSVDGGRYFAPEGTPFENLALPYDESKMIKSTYVVNAPMKVKAGEVAPFFDQPGGGTQFLSTTGTKDLLSPGAGGAPPILKPAN